MNGIFFNENLQDCTNSYDGQIFNSNIQRPRRNSFSDLNYNSNYNEISIDNRFNTEMTRRNSGGNYGTSELTNFLPQNLNNITLPNSSNNMINKQSLRPSLKLKINIANAEAKKRRHSLGYFIL